jgi:hypothetical protein
MRQHTTLEPSHSMTNSAEHFLVPLAPKTPRQPVEQPKSVMRHSSVVKTAFRQKVPLFPGAIKIR